MNEWTVDKKTITSDENIEDVLQILRKTENIFLKTWQDHKNMLKELLKNFKRYVDPIAKKTWPEH